MSNAPACEVANPAAPVSGVGTLAGLLWAVLGGLLAWAAIAAFDPLFLLPVELRNVDMYSPREKIVARDAAAPRIYWQNTAAILGQMGALVGALLAIGDGVSRKAGRRILGGMCLVGVTGTAFALLGGGLGELVRNGYTAYYGAVDAETELFRTILVQSVMLGTTGAGIGLGWGLLQGRLGSVGRAILGGVLGGALAGVVYPFAAASLLPNDITETLIPLGPYNRLLWIGLASAILGATIPGMKLNRSRR